MPALVQSIALHIGAHKTASSHLQNVLYRNRRLLADQSIRYYGPGYLREEDRNLAALFDLSWSSSPSPKRSADEQLAHLSKGCKRVVFSEENFTGTLFSGKATMKLPPYPLGAERVAELVAKFAPLKTQLFLAVRNPASFVSSSYSQALFAGNTIAPAVFRKRNNWGLIDWADYIAQLRAVPGVGTICIWRQEDYERSHRLILRRLLRWRVGPMVETIEGRLHQGLSETALHQALDWAKEGKTGMLGREAREAFPVGPDHKPFQLYDPATLEKAQASYTAQMARIEEMDDVKVLHPPTRKRKG